MSFDQLIAALIGAFFGSAGWLLVGLYMQGRQAERQARNAARAVYFELVMNEIDVRVAADHLVFQDRRRGSFDRLLPELATWLTAEDLEVIVQAYMSHAGYEQAERDDKLPATVRMTLLRKVLDQHLAATRLLRRRAFSPHEAARLASSAATAEGGPESATHAPAGARNV